MPDTDKPLPAFPESKIVPRKRAGISFVWLIPLVAAGAGIWIGVNTIRNQGPKLTIVFRSADGLEATKTKIRYNGIDVGTMTSVQLSEDHLSVVGTAKMSPKTEAFFVKDTKFWVVRPQISGATVTGLGTLISGAYIGMEIGKSTESERNFLALDDAPLETGGVHGRFFMLTSPELGSLAKGTPIYFRRLEAGKVVSYELNKDGKSLSVKVFVQTPYDQYVTPNTRFWQASGVDVSLTASGLKVQTESFLSILIGGLAFETPATGPLLPPADADTTFPLYKDREEAFRPPAANPQTYMVVFKQSVRGLAIGAPVELQGIPIGQVIDMQAQFDTKTFEFSVPVTLQVDPARFGVKLKGLAAGETAVADRKKLMDTLVARGLRAQMKTGSLISGSQFIAVDFYPDAPPVTLDWSQEPVQLPTLPGAIESLEDNLASIIKKIDSMPLKGIGDDLHKTIVDLDTTIGNLDKTLTGAQGTLTNADQLLGNASKLIAPNAALDEHLNALLQDLGGAAQAIRLLADFLERHPEALIRGKSGDAK